jgi:hypothetical protein
MGSTGEAIATILLAIIGVAIIAVFVSNQSNTANVVTAGGSGFASALRCALSPVTGGSCPSSGGLFPNVSSTISYSPIGS